MLIIDLSDWVIDEQQPPLYPLYYGRGLAMGDAPPSERWIGLDIHMYLGGGCGRGFGNSDGNGYGTHYETYGVVPRLVRNV
jgi:hypothetical protein